MVYSGLCVGGPRAGEYHTSRGEPTIIIALWADRPPVTAVVSFDQLNSCSIDHDRFTYEYDEIPVIGGPPIGIFRPAGSNMEWVMRELTEIYSMYKDLEH